MSLSELERRRFERTVGEFIERRRPPAHIRQKLDLGFRVTGQSVEIFSLRPRWDEPAVKMESAVARATLVKRQRVWKVFWQRADLKWHRYDPVPEVPSLERFLELVEKDEYSCFFG